MSNPVSTDTIKLTITGVTGVRGYTILFRDLNFQLRSGQFAALSGPNGSGKTTLLRMIAGLIHPETGTITRPEEAREHGPFYLGHENGLRPNDTAGQHLKDWTDLHNADHSGIVPVLERVGLSDRAFIPAYALSAGQKKRIGLARALIVPRRLWLLDEPAAALDKTGQALLCDLIREHTANGGLCLAALHDALDLQADLTLNLADYQP